MSDSSAAIRIRDLSFRYAPEALHALQGVSLDIPAGAITALLGPNGSGKTTLLHLILGLLTPTAGDIEIAGRQRNGYARRDMSRLMGLVPQLEPIVFDLTLLEYVLLGRAPYLNLLDLPSSRDREIALHMLEAVGLSELRDRPVTTLSGGERQLATVARALTQEPRILLLDEPTSHLDLANKQRALQMLCQLRHDGKTVIFTTHDPNVAGATADQIVLMRQGRILAAGATASVLKADLLSATYGIPVEVTCVQDKVLVITP